MMGNHDWNPLSIMIKATYPLSRASGFASVFGSSRAGGKLRARLMAYSAIVERDELGRRPPTAKATDPYESVAFSFTPA